MRILTILGISLLTGCTGLHMKSYNKGFYDGSKVTTTSCVGLIKNEVYTRKQAINIMLGAQDIRDASHSDR